MLSTISSYLLRRFSLRVELAFHDCILKARIKGLGASMLVGKLVVAPVLIAVLVVVIEVAAHSLSLLRLYYNAFH
jgi:hypothetical protein